MKKPNYPFTKLIATATIAGALLAATSSRAGNATTNWFSFDAGTAAWALPAWGGQGAGSAWDSTTDHTGNGGGSLHVIDDYSLGDQLVDLGWMSGSAWSSTLYDLTGWTNVSFYVKWDTAASTIGVATFNGSPGETPQFWGATTPNWAWYTIGTFTVPDTASNGWVKINVPINPTTPGVTANMVLGIKKWTAANNTGIAAFWVDDITLEGDTAAVIPNPTLYTPTKPAPGLNLFALTGPYNRNNLQTVNDQAWIGQPGPVSYSFTIAKGVDGSDGSQFQNHIILVPNPGTESGPDWNEPNAILLDMESQNNGGALVTFRYKTNQPNGNSMMYDTAVVPANLTNSSPVGTWTLTFNTANNIALTAPDSTSTNFTIPADSAALFAGPLYAYFGVQANNSTAVGKQAILSKIKITGTANPIDDAFTNGAPPNPDRWLTNAVDAGSVFVTPSNAAYWVKWSLPDAGFSLEGSSALTGSLWNDIAGTKLQVNGQRWKLVTTDSLPSANTGFFRLIKRTFTKLQVLFPGQTNAPGTALGYVGTPTPVSVSEGQLTTVTVNAVDDTFHIISGVSDTIHLTSSDPSAYLPGDLSMNNGVATFADSNGVLFITPGQQTVTATDLTSTTVTDPATSAEITINP